MKNKKIIFIILFFLFFIFLIPFTISKYSTRISRKVTLNIGEMAIFKQYNGAENLLGFSKSSITSFSRNTELTKEQVLLKSGVQLISNQVNDGYKSSYEIYGCVENNEFYCFKFW